MIIPGFLIGIIKHVRVDISDKTLTVASDQPSNSTRCDAWKQWCILVDIACGFCTGNSEVTAILIGHLDVICAKRSDYKYRPTWTDHHIIQKPEILIVRTVCICYNLHTTRDIGTIRFLICTGQMHNRCRVGIDLD